MTPPEGEEGTSCCSVKVKLVVPAGCRLDEEKLRVILDTATPMLFMGACESCPLSQGISVGLSRDSQKPRSEP